MPRGQPDYGVYQPQQAIAGLADIGELVPRLDGINRYDRRGFTIWQDDFEAPVLRWTTVVVAGGVAAVLNTTRAFSGVQCAYLNVPAGAANQSAVRRRFPLIRTGNIGIEMWLQGFTKTVGYLRIRVYIYDGVTPYLAELHFDTDARTISIVHATGTTVIATLVYMSVTLLYFLPIKLVVNSNTDMYVRLMVGELEYDISAYSQVAQVPSTAKMVEVDINVVGSAANDMWMYIDDFILTQNEP